MARPSKKGLDYFPVDTTILSDIKIRRIKRKFGAEAFLLYIALLCDIYVEGFFLPITDDYLFELSESLAIPENRIREMLASMADVGLFHAVFYQENRVLTSTGIQNRFLLATGKRINNQKIKENKYWIIPDETSIMPDKTPVNAPGSTQRKEEERKENNKVVVANALFHDNCNSYGKELLDDEDWLASIVRISGKGTHLLELLPDVMDLFYHHIVSQGQNREIRNKSEYTRRLINWWRCLKFRPAGEIGRTGCQSSKPAYPAGCPPDAPFTSKASQAILLSQEVEQKVKQILSQ